MNNGSWQKPFKTKQEVKDWCKDNQPYYKKHIPDVAKYFYNKSNLKQKTDGKTTICNRWLQNLGQDI